jgi:hypothetical protein
MANNNYTIQTNLPHTHTQTRYNHKSGFRVHLTDRQQGAICIHQELVLHCIYIWLLPRDMQHFSHRYHGKHNAVLCLIYTSI